MRVSDDATAITQAVETFGLRQHLNADLLRGLRLYTFPAQAVVYAQAADPVMLYLLVQGRIEVHINQPSGRQAVLAVMEPLSLVGDVELFSRQPILSTVTALEPCRFLGIDRAAALRWGGDDPRFLRLIIANLTAKLQGSSSIQSERGLPLTARLAAHLLRQAASDTLSYSSKTQLAALLGSTPRHLNRVLRLLENAGLLRATAGRIQVLDRARLERLSEG